MRRSAGTNSSDALAGVAGGWQRFSSSSIFNAVTDASQFAIVIPAGTSLDIFGPQVDAQKNPSPYVTSAGLVNNVYTGALFDMAHLDITTTGPNRNSCVISIRCHLSNNGDKS
jgi:hypothetical protein